MDQAGLPRETRTVMIGRRAAIGGAMSALGGIGPRRPDQRMPAESRAGTGPAPGSAFIVARRVIVVGTNSGVFVYNGTPAAGNLIASIAPAGGPDPYGNAVEPGIASYNGTAIAGQFISSALRFFSLTSPPTTPPTVYSNLAGAASAELNLSSGKGTVAATAVTATMLDSLASLEGVAQMVVAALNSPVAPLTAALLDLQGSAAISGGVWALAATPSGTGPAGAEGWNSLGSIAGFGIGAHHRYRLISSPPNSVQIDIEETGAAGTATSYNYPNVLPAAYRPTQDTRAPAATTGAIALGNSTPRVFIAAATGQVQLAGMPSAAYAGPVSAHFEYALD